MSNLLLVPLDEIVVFPNMSVTVSVDVGDEERVFLVPRHEGEYAKVGTVAEVGETLRLPGGGRAVSLSGLHRGLAGAAQTDPQGRLRVEVEERPDEEPPGVKTRELQREYRATVDEILELRGDDGRIASRALDPRDRHAGRHRGIRAGDDLRREDRAARGDRR